MPWLLKVFLVSAMLGACVFLAAAIPLLPVRLGFLAAGGFVFLWSMRDPALTYRRAFHFLIVLPVIPLGFSVSANLFGAGGQQSGILKIVVDGSQAIPPLLWGGLATLCLLGDVFLVKRERDHRAELYEVEAVHATIIENQKLVRIDFPFHPPRAVAISGSEISLRGIGSYSDCVTTLVTAGAETNEATSNTPQTVAADTLAKITASLALDEQALRRIRKRRGGLRRHFPIKGAVKLRANAKIITLPITLA